MQVIASAPHRGHAIPLAIAATGALMVASEGPRGDTGIVMLDSSTSRPVVKVVQGPRFHRFARRGEKLFLGWRSAGPSSVLDEEGVLGRDGISLSFTVHTPGLDKWGPGGFDDVCEILPCLPRPPAW
ncbi:hypothetical protein E4U49_002750 [Claviceps purpurea]|nr:hypothetical protein E4U49_002750 [Claviceps purpurea]